jgi:glycosyltransferase involved in cell wall biosynthesis
VSWDQAADSLDHWDMADAVEVVHCAVDTGAFVPSSRTATGRPSVLSRHSRDTPEKYSQYLLQIFNRVGEYHEVTLQMLGALETIGQVGDRRVDVYAQGSLDVCSFLGKSDIWLYSHASYWRETACIAMLEAMACGLPVVVSNAGGLREYLRPGETGFVCNEMEEFVRFTRLLLSNDGLRMEMSINARQFVEQRHSLKALTARVSELIDK